VVKLNSPGSWMCGNVHDKNCWRVSQAEDTRSIFKAEVSSVYTQTQTNTLLDAKATASHRFCNGDENISVRRFQYIRGHSFL